jgi:hypothetical protein
LRSLNALLAALLAAACVGCASTGNANAPISATADAQGSPTAPIVRRGFLGAFFRPVGPPPFGVFSVYSKNTAPEPYPHERTVLFGSGGYCDVVAANGVSISSGNRVDDAKVKNLTDLGVKWTRTPVSADYDDQSHIFGAGKYSFADFDSAQCALLRHHILPIVNLEDGPVHYNAVEGGYAPKEVPGYKTAADFGTWCGAVGAHERKTFGITRYSLPGNEVNSDPKTYPGGDAQIAAYSIACYHALKAAVPNAFVYGFELNMEGKLDAPGFVQRMYALGCKRGTCYDAISMHLYTRYPIAPASTPCYPNPGGDYSLQCVADVRKATHVPQIHILIGETAFLVPATVPDEGTKARAVVDLMQRFAADPLIDGVNYANVDECDLYPTGFFVGGCLVDSIGTKLPAFTALQKLARDAY